MTIELVASTGQETADTVVRAVAALFDTVFPGRLRGLYVEGSYSDESAVATSDIDLIVLFKESFRDDAERETAAKVASYCAALSTLELDFDVVDEAKVMSGALPMLKLGSRLLYGEDVRERIPLMPIEEWTRQRMHAAFWLMINLFHRPRIVHLLLTFPDPTDEFYGYLRRTVRLPDGSEVPTTRNLIRVTGWAATALIALKARQYVVRKRECVATYRRDINDEWADFLEQLYHQCRREWNYLIPNTAEECATLRALCEQTLAFENHFLSEYQRFLVGELRSGDEQAVRSALYILGHTLLAEEEVLDSVRGLADTSSIVGERARAVLNTHYYPTILAPIEDENCSSG